MAAIEITQTVDSTVKHVAVVSPCILYSNSAILPTHLINNEDLHTILSSKSQYFLLGLRSNCVVSTY